MGVVLQDKIDRLALEINFLESYDEDALLSIQVIINDIVEELVGKNKLISKLFENV